MRWILKSVYEKDRQHRRNFGSQRNIAKMMSFQMSEMSRPFWTVKSGALFIGIISPCRGGRRGWGCGTLGEQVGLGAGRLTNWRIFYSKEILSKIWRSFLKHPGNFRDHFLKKPKASYFVRSFVKFSKKNGQIKENRKKTTIYILTKRTTWRVEEKMSPKILKSKCLLLKK